MRDPATDGRPALRGLAVADPPERWAALGFTVAGAAVELGGVRLGLGAPGRGIVAWTLAGTPPADSIDGLPTRAEAAAARLAHADGAPSSPGHAGRAPGSGAHANGSAGHADRSPRHAGRAPGSGGHANGAVGLDHVVVLSPDFDRTAAALADHGMPLRRTRTVGAGEAAFRQGFRRLGPAILELVEARDAPPGPARFWGLVVVVADLDALAGRLGPERCSAPKPAVQPGRRIATVRRAAGLSLPVAFMDPEPAL